MASAEKKLEKPLPRPGHESRPFWEGAKAGKLMLPRCDACGEFWFPPSERCPHCLSTNFQWREAKGEGRIYSFVVYHRVYHPAFEADVPYVVAIVELDEGPRLLTNIVGAPDKVRCDARVRVEFVQASAEVVLPKFALVK
jgi:uncharacterized OB-fold protein